LRLFDQAHVTLGAKAFKINFLQHLAAHVVCAWSKRHKRGSGGVSGDNRRPSVAKKASGRYKDLNDLEHLPIP